MVEDAPDGEFDSQQRDAERLAATADAHRSAWEQTLADLDALAGSRREEDWTVVRIAAGDAGPETAGQGVTDYHGITYVVPGNRAEAFREAFEAGEFPSYDVYRQVVDGRLFLVTELLDPGTETAVLVAGNFWLHAAGPCVREAREAGTMYTHLRKLDNTHLGSFEHEGYEKFFPDPDGVIEDWRAMGGGV